MIIHDYECQECGQISENFIIDSSFIPNKCVCPICGAEAKKIVSLSHTVPVDADWIKSVHEVVDKESDKPHCKEFLKHPTRANYKAWMKGEGLRPLESGEPTKPKVDQGRRKTEIKNGMLERFRERNAVSVSTSI